MPNIPISNITFLRLVRAGVEKSARTYTPLLAALAEQGRVEEMEEIVKEMDHEGIKKDPFIYNSLLQGYSNVGNHQRVEELFQHMLTRYAIVVF